MVRGEKRVNTSKPLKVGGQSEKRVQREKKRTRPINTQEVVPSDDKTTRKQPKNKLNYKRGSKNSVKSSGGVLDITRVCSD